MTDHVMRNSSRLSRYHLVRGELLEIARTSRVLNQMPQPMEIGGSSLKVPGEDAESPIPVLVIVDERTGCVFSRVCGQRCEPLRNPPSH